MRVSSGCGTRHHGSLPCLISRIAALEQLGKFGIYLTGLKQAAVMRGDISNTIIHPFFVPGTVALGMRLRAGVKVPPEMLRLHAKYGQLAFEQVVEIVKGNDANLTAQVFLYVAAVCLYERWFRLSRQYLTKACIALNAASLQFTPATGRPPALTEDVHERLVILSQAIYLENYHYLAVDGVEPKMTARIEKEFRHELEVSVRFLAPCGVG